MLCPRPSLLGSSASLLLVLWIGSCGSAAEPAGGDAHGERVADAAPAAPGPTVPGPTVPGPTVPGPTDSGSTEPRPAEGAGAGPDADGAPLATAERPNVLLLIVDDLRPTLGCYGDPIARTPHIDRLATESLLLESAYCQQALCSPSRSSMLTGRRPNTTGVWGLRQHFREALPDVVTLPQRFRAAGYRTEALGKVHHGHGDLDDEPSWTAPPWRPTGWEHYHTEESLAQQRRLAQRLIELGYEDEVARGPATEIAPVPGEELVDGLIATEAIRRLESYGDESFFLAVGFRKPHLPFVAPRECFERYAQTDFAASAAIELPDGTPAFVGTGGGELRASTDVPDEGPLSEALQRRLIHAYYACTSHVDDQIGRVLAALDRLELTERTIVVLWSDHGFQLGELGQWCKHTNFELAVRAPFLVRLPREGWLPDELADVRARGRRSSGLVEFVDLYPTLAELAGLSVDDGLEGTSFVPLFREPGRAWKRAAFSQYPRLVPSLKQRGTGFSMRTDRYRLTLWRSRGEDVATELYDYAEGAIETRNLAADPAYAGLLEELGAQLERGWRAARPE